MFRLLLPAVIGGGITSAPQSTSNEARGRGMSLVMLDLLVGFTALTSLIFSMEFVSIFLSMMLLRTTALWVRWRPLLALSMRRREWLAKRVVLIYWIFGLRRRRQRINEKMKALQKLIPNSNKTDKASMLDEAIEYLKQLQLQVQMLWAGCGMQRKFRGDPLVCCVPKLRKVGIEGGGSQGCFLGAAYGEGD
ncbi:uncharacterized protein LOC110726185 isoform X1 [Chenopodium quinoa]|uniref:uncharacterized protein LOC110726185 isoform X1 n=1 Tax=Chenopodium quinoa TaxID=63459 RepID=UPI000B771EF0|nr:uncharacterized protein LOC110726185 isoform X1 [Chenopodium quinoa]